MGRMGSFVCGSIFFLIAFGYYTRFKSEKALGNGRRANLSLIISVICGAFAVIFILAATFNP